MLYTCAECLPDTSDRMSICSIIILNVSYHNLHRRFFYSCIQLLNVGLYIIYIMFASYIQIVYNPIVNIENII